MVTMTTLFHYNVTTVVNPYLLHVECSYVATHYSLISYYISLCVGDFKGSSCGI